MNVSFPNELIFHFFFIIRVRVPQDKSSSSSRWNPNPISFSYTRRSKSKEPSLWTFPPNPPTKRITNSEFWCVISTKLTQGSVGFSSFGSFAFSRASTSRRYSKVGVLALCDSVIESTCSFNSVYPKTWNSGELKFWEGSLQTRSIFSIFSFENGGSD